MAPALIKPAWPARSRVWEDANNSHGGSAAAQVVDTAAHTEADHRKTSRASDARASTAAVLLLAALALFPYLNALRTGFTFDDESQIRTNPAVVGGIDLLRILASPLAPGSLFRPMTVMSFAINEWFTPSLPAPFHATNVGLHVAVTLLVYLLAKRLFKSGRAPFVSAALFAVHPIHTEAVTSLVGRAELLAALCGVGALLSMAGANAARTPLSETGLQAASLILFCLALLSKESALTVLPAMVLFRIAMRGESLPVGLRNEARSLDWVPYGLCAILFVLWHAMVTAGAAPSDLTPLDNTLAFVPWAVRVRSAFGILWDYFGLLNVPLVLSADYSYNQVPAIMSWWAPRFWAGSGLVALAAVYCLRRRWTAVAFAIALPFVTLSLTANVFFPIGTTKAERLLYLPSVGWALLVGWGLDRLAAMQRYRAAALMVLLTVIFGFATRTWIRNYDWRNNDVLYESTAGAAPDSAKARYNFGVALQRHGDNETAAAQFHRALEIYPWAEGAALGIGIGFENDGRTEAAVEWYRKALQITRSFHQGHLSLCRVLASAHRFVEAAAACRAGLRYRPADPELLKGLGASLVGTGATQQGIEVLHRSLTLNPGDGNLRTYLLQLGSG